MDRHERDVYAIQGWRNDAIICALSVISSQSQPVVPATDNSQRTTDVVLVGYFFRLKPTGKFPTVTGNLPLNGISPNNARTMAASAPG